MFTLRAIASLLASAVELRNFSLSTRAITESTSVASAFALRPSSAATEVQRKLSSLASLCFSVITLAALPDKQASPA